MSDYPGLDLSRESRQSRNVNKKSKKKIPLKPMSTKLLMWVGMLVLILVLAVTTVLSVRANANLKKELNHQNDLLKKQEEEIERLGEELIAKKESNQYYDEIAIAMNSGGVVEPVVLKEVTGYKEYQDLFPDLYVHRPESWVERPNTVFLTFDDGPSIYTERILDTLKDRGVKATFFVMGHTNEKSKAIMQRIVDEGHTIAMHTFTHTYKQIYASVEAYLNDIQQISDLIYENTGVKPDLFRFAGGSVNSFNKALHEEISAEMMRRGYTYYDWNASSGDTAGNTSPSTVYNSSMIMAGKESRVILLMHDIKEATMKALPDIIDGYAAKGYEFGRLTNVDKPMAFNLR